MVDGIYSSRRPKKRKRKALLVFLVLCALAWGIAYLIHNAFASDMDEATVATTPKASKSTIPSAPQTLISPAITTQTSSAMTALQNTWAGIINGRNGDVDIAVYDNSTGQTAHYTNVGGTFNTASIVKLSILEEVLLQDQAQGQSITADQLAKATPMIEESDNDSATDLWNEVGGASSMNDFFSLVGATSSAAGAADLWGLTQTTALDQLAVVNALAYPGEILTQASATTADSLLDQVASSQAWGVNAGVPAGVTVELKNGWLPDNNTTDVFSHTSDWIVNSVGHVYGNGVDYTIAVLTDGQPSEQYGIETVENLSTATWDALGAGAATN